jgi:hypothetical protein
MLYGSINTTSSSQITLDGDEVVGECRRCGRAGPRVQLVMVWAAACADKTP